jgi:nicotinamidase-related amidase
VTKGSNLWTEHYSAVQADVPDPEDPDTQLNMRLIETLQEADEIILAGEARSHCLANTVLDIANNFGEENIKKMVLLEDGTSDVPGFENLGEDFVKEMKGRGMRISTTTDYLK